MNYVSNDRSRRKAVEINFLGRDFSLSHSRFFFFLGQGREERVHSTIGERDPMKARFTRLFDPPASPIFSRNLVVCKRFLRQTRKVFHSAWSYFRLPVETITIVPSKFEGNNMARRVNVRLNFNKHRILSRSPL